MLIEHRHGLVVNSRLTQATGPAEWEAPWTMAKEIPGRRRATLGADKHYDDRDFVACVRTLHVTPWRRRRSPRSTRAPRAMPATASASGSASASRCSEDGGAVRQTRFRGRERVPLGEPIAWRGPIVMNTQQELRVAFDELHRGTFIKTRG
jgi:hypothetical protein